MASPTQWTWVWVNSGSWWWTGRPGMLQSMGSLSQTVRHDWATELNLTELRPGIFLFEILHKWLWGFPGGSDGKEFARNAGDLDSVPGVGRSPGGGNGYSSICAWRILWTEKPSELQSMSPQRFGHDWATNTFTFTIGDSESLQNLRTTDYIGGWFSSWHFAAFCLLGCLHLVCLMGISNWKKWKNCGSHSAAAFNSFLSFFLPKYISGLSPPIWKILPFYKQSLTVTG